MYYIDKKYNYDRHLTTNHHEKRAAAVVTPPATPIPLIPPETESNLNEYFVNLLNVVDNLEIIRKFCKLIKDKPTLVRILNDLLNYSEDDVDIKGYVYMFRYMTSQQKYMYKVGQTIDPFNRFNKLSVLGPEILCINQVKDMTVVETALIQGFKAKYKLAHGREFFYCDDDKDTIINLYRNIVN